MPVLSILCSLVQLSFEGASGIIMRQILLSTQHLQSVNYMPGMRVPFSPLNILGAVLPCTWWNPSMEWCWKWRKTGLLFLFNRERIADLL